MLLITVVLFFSGILLTLLSIFGIHDMCYEWYQSFIFVFGCIIIGSGLCMLLSIPFERWSSSDFIKAVEATQLTINEQRENPGLTEYERATITKEIVEVNQEIAEQKNAYKTWRSKYWLVPEIKDIKLVK